MGLTQTSKRHKNHHFMKRLLTILFILSLSVSYGQQLRFKKNYTFKSHKSLSFKTDRALGNIKGGNTSLTLTLKNTSEESMDLNKVQLALVDASGRGVKLCGNTKILKPGGKVTVRLEACNDNYGLFMMNKEYATKHAFREDALFVRGKEWRLKIGQDVIVFYTDF